MTLPRVLLLSLILQISSPTLALSGDLGTWLRVNVGPELVQLMEREPRFIGETIQIVSLDTGQPTRIGDALTSEIRDELRHLLLNHSKVRLPLQAAAECSSDISIYLGISIDRKGRTGHRVQLVLLDVEDDLWISGSSHVWQGRLTREQVRQLRIPTVSAAAPQYAQLYTRPSGSQANLPAQKPDCVVNESTVPRPAVLSPVSVDNRRIECRGQGKNCIDINYETYDEAFVFEFFTRNGELFALNCDETPTLTDGAMRRGLRIPESGHPDRPALGFYVIATQQFHLAQQISDLLHNLSSSCEGSASADSRAALSALVDDPGINWQAIFLTNNRGRISAMEVSS